MVSKIIIACAAACGCAASFSALAQATPHEPASGWSGSVTAGGFVRPDYEGASGTVARPILGPMVSYQSEHWGTFSLSQGLTWTMQVNGQDTLGIGLSGDAGRTDASARSGGIFNPRPGSARLAGMGRIGAAPVINLFGSTAIADVPFFVAVHRALGSEDGLLVDVGSSVPWKPTANTTLTFGPSVTWEDRRYARAYFGVDPTQSSLSGFSTFDPHAGIKSARFVIGVDVAVSGAWHVVGGADGERLVGDAGRSPIVEKRNQFRAMAGVQYRF